MVLYIFQCQVCGRMMCIAAKVKKKERGMLFLIMANQNISCGQHKGKHGLHFKKLHSTFKFKAAKGKCQKNMGEKYTIHYKYIKLNLVCTIRVITFLVFISLIDK